MFATAPIKAGEVVVIWGGAIIKIEDFKSGIGLQHTNVGLDDGLCLVALESEDLSPDDFMNHSCNPNLWLSNAITLAARRDISIGEELTIDYSTEVAEEIYTMKQPCNCRSSSCRNTITGMDWLLPEIQEAYKNHFSPFIQRRIDNLSDGQK